MKPDFSSTENDKDPKVQMLLKMLKDMYQEGYQLEYIFAAAIWEPLQAAFRKRYGVKESPRSSPLTPAVLSGKRPKSRSGPMGLDHTTLWLKDGQPHLMTTEPYQISKESLKELIEHCDEHGIDFVIDTKSSYFPSRTLRILFEKAGENN